MTDRKLLEMFKRIKIIFPYTYKDYDEKDIAIWQSTWKELLKEYDDKLIDYAFKKAMGKCKQPPVPADILEELQELKKACEKSNAELWDEAQALIWNAKDLSAMFIYTAKGANGKTQGENAKEELLKMFDKADEAIKEYFGSVSNLLSISKNQTEENAIYERARFFKTINEFKKRVINKKEYSNLLLDGVVIKVIGGVK